MMKSEMPLNWLKVNISDVCDKVTDGSHNPPKASAEGLPMLSAKNINSGRVFFDKSHRLIDEESFEREDSRTKICVNDVLLTVVGTLGRVAIVTENLPRFTLQRSVAVLSAKNLESQFFRYVVESPGFQAQIFENAKGTAQKGIYLKKLRELEFNLPPLAEQKQIATKLDQLLSQVNTLKNRLDKIPTILKRFRQSVLAAAVSGKLTERWRGENKFIIVKNLSDKCFDERCDFIKKRLMEPVELSEIPNVELPSNWLWSSIDQCAIKITDGTHHSPKSHVKGDFMYVTSKNVRAGFIDLSHITFIDKITHDEIYARCDVVQGDILYVKDGANTGLACVNNIEEEISLLSSVGVIRPCSYIKAKYLELYLNSPIGRKLMLGMMGGTAIPRLTLTKIKNAPISVPPIEEQIEIVRQVEKLIAFADQIEKQVNSAQTKVNNLTQSILAKAFRGELTAEWREQNPDLISGENSAEALLEKIKAERQSIQKNKPKRTVKKKKSKLKQSA